MNFNTRELNAIGHWPSPSKIDERYDRSVCANELSLRNAIIRKIIEGRAKGPSFRLPECASGDLRIGKAVGGPLFLGPRFSRILQTWDKPLFAKAGISLRWRTAPLSSLTLHLPFPRPMNRGRSMNSHSHLNVLNSH